MQMFLHFNLSKILFAWCILHDNFLRNYSTNWKLFYFSAKVAYCYKMKKKVI